MIVVISIGRLVCVRYRVTWFIYVILFKFWNKYRIVIIIFKDEKLGLRLVFN